MISVMQLTQLLKDELGWRPKYNFEENLKKTVKWYLDNKSWCYKVLKKVAMLREIRT